VHEIGHTFGLWHVFRGDGMEHGLPPGSFCADPCFEGSQYPLTQNGSFILGDLCDDTRPTIANFECRDPQPTADPTSLDCDGKPWSHTPVHNWMGFPFMMIVALGGLTAIPHELYEAADLDGASRWDKLRNIILPQLMPVLVPAVLLGTVWTFNNTLVILLVSHGGEPAD